MFGERRLVYPEEKGEIGHIWCRADGVSEPIGDGVHVECSVV